MIISGKTEEDLNSAMKNLSTDLVSEPGEMLTILTESKERGTAVGIYAPVLGAQIFVTAVEDIIITEEITIVIKSYDTTGYILETNKLKLQEIACVCPFKSPFENPFMRTIKSGKAL